MIAPQIFYVLICPMYIFLYVSCMLQKMKQQNFEIINLNSLRPNDSYMREQPSPSLA